MQTATVPVFTTQNSRDSVADKSHPDGTIAAYAAKSFGGHAVIPNVLGTVVPS
jgi:hypothetical protein